MTPVNVTPVNVTPVNVTPVNVTPTPSPLTGPLMAVSWCERKCSFPAELQRAERTARVGPAAPARPGPPRHGRAAVTHTSRRRVGAQRTPTWTRSVGACNVASLTVSARNRRRLRQQLTSPPTRP